MGDDDVTQVGLPRTRTADVLAADNRRMREAIAALRDKLEREVFDDLNGVAGAPAMGMSPQYLAGWNAHAQLVLTLLSEMT